jgi:hypothetical protein
MNVELIYPSVSTAWQSNKVASSTCSAAVFFGCHFKFGKSWDSFLPSFCALYFHFFLLENPSSFPLFYHQKSRKSRSYFIPKV